MSSLAHRIRKVHSKTRTGCLTCKRRRIKCDETKPDCRQCTQTLRKCEGYNPPKAWVFEPKATGDGKTTTPESALTIKAPGSTGDIVESAHLRSYQFFVERTTPILSAYFGKSFWSVMLPQVSLFQPTVKYALLALSTATEAIEYSHVDPVHDKLFQASYSSAIKALVATDSTPSIQFVLMACLLFANADFVRGNVPSALRHIQSGLNMLDEWCRAKSHERDRGYQTPEGQVLLSMAPIFGQYIEKSKTYGLSSPLRFHNVSLIQAPCELPYIPTRFFSINEAEHCLDGISHYVAWVVDCAADDDCALSMAQRIMSKLHSLKEACDISWSIRDMEIDTVSQTIIRAHHKVLTMVLSGWLVSNDTQSSAVDENILSILDMYHQISRFCKGQNTGTAWISASSLAYHLGFIPPLFFAATQARSTTLRLGAFYLLRKLNVFESNWSSCFAYKLAQTLNTIHDNRLPLPCCARITSEQHPVYIHEIVNDTPDTATMTYSCGRCRDLAAVVVTHEIGVSDLQCADQIHWPLRRIARVSGYQGGGIPRPGTCDCELGPEDDDGP